MTFQFTPVTHMVYLEIRLHYLDFAIEKLTSSNWISKYTMCVTGVNWKVKFLSACIKEKELIWITHLSIIRVNLRLSSWIHWKLWSHICTIFSLSICFFVTTMDLITALIWLLLYFHFRFDNKLFLSTEKSFSRSVWGVYWGRINTAP